ncbi:MAG: oxidoreductase [Ancrocorticia sp.]|uniref:oxidoreductase n=1 Tax=Ancrocorticia sp. TaxID=2593684 RepID=UPI003F91573B
MKETKEVTVAMATWFITGCSTGFGRALAEEVLAAGHSAAITARNTDHLSDLASQYPQTVLVLPLDVTDQKQITAAARATLEHFGQVDVVVNNAGYGYRAAVEEATSAEIERLFATNFHGPVNVMKAFLPSMRARRSGMIINMSSMGARTHYQASGYYAATKSALEAVTGSLAKEIAPLEIKTMIVEPGSFRTDFSGRSIALGEVRIADYDETAGKRRAKKSGTQPGDPAKAARVIIAAAEADDPPRLLLLGPDAYEKVVASLNADLAEVAQWQDVSCSTDF